MRLLDRYVLSEFARYFILSALVLTLVFFIAEYLRGVWDAEVGALTLLQYDAFMLPVFLCQMLPPSAMIGTMVTLSLLNRRNELTAIQASGIGLGHIAFLIFGGIFIGCCFSLMVYDRVIPPMARQQRIFYWKVIKGRQDFSLDIKTSKIWYRSKNFIYNLKLYDKATSTIRGISVFFFDDRFRLVQYVEAETAHYDTVKSVWELKNGMLTIFPESDTFPLSKHFVEKKLTLPETPNDFLEIERRVDTLRLKELRSFIRRNKDAGLDTKVYEVDFHSRVAGSFISLVMGLLAIPYCVRPKRQGGLGKDLAVCMGWTFAYWLSFSISLSLGKSGALTPWVAVWTIPAFFLMAAITLVVRARAT